MLVQIHDVIQRNRACGFGYEQAELTRLDQTAYLWHGRCEHPMMLHLQIDAVIRNQIRTERHHLQRQTGLSCTGRTDDQKPASGKRNAGGMYTGPVLTFGV